MAFARARGEGRLETAEVIDLVHLPRGTRPTPIAFLELEEVQRCRSLDCDHYARCLGFAARVHWRSFHCRQCPLYPREQRGAASPYTAREQGALAAVIKLR